ncbi:hypothetical protein [Amycolatopsis sp. NPDC052450]|uniref:hypothetical protein n=1 Tax=Amycolatopsis sp. NPDC052450 TaxID=3363937 RepID=UPI0037CBC5D0
MALGGLSKQALVSGSAFMTDLGSLFPVRLKLTGEELEFLFVLPPGRTFAELESRVRLRVGAVKGASMPRFAVESGVRWTRLRVELAGTSVGTLIVMPEEMTAQALNAPFLGRWQEQMPSIVQLALDEIARILTRCHHEAGGAGPLIDLELSYLPEQDYRTKVARTHDAVKECVAPVRPVLRMRWNSVTSVQRKAFVDELTNIEITGKWPRRRLTARIMGLELELPAWTAPKARPLPGSSSVAGSKPGHRARA